jgi:RNA polymerase sigma-70 factor (ECF subfamily)
MLEPVTESHTPDPSPVHAKRAALTSDPPCKGDPGAKGELPDLLLVERARGKDARAFETLMRRYNRRLFRIARSILPDDDAAVDAVQEAHLRAFANLDRYEPTGKFGSWLARLAFNEALMLRRRARPSIAPVGQSVAAGPASPAPLVSVDQLEVSQARQLLEHAIDGLPEVFRTVFVLRVVEQLTGVETAACLGLNETTVRTRLYRAQQRLRVDLARRMRAERFNIFYLDSSRCDRIVDRVLVRLHGTALLQAPG